MHDYSGHPFQIQLSRELTRRGHVVQHQYCPSYVSGHGDMERRPSDPSGFSVTGVALRRPFSRYRAGVRAAQEFEYAMKAFRAIVRARPDVAVLCNVPLLANFVLVLLLRAKRVPYVFWHQDVYSAAIADALGRRAGRIGHLAGAIAEGLERSIARNASRIVAITEVFADKYAQWKIPPDRWVVVPNWAELDQFPRALAADRGWLEGTSVRRHVLLYSGTLGLKHDPGLLLELARAEELSDCSVVVISEGKGRDWLAERLDTVDDGRLILRDFVPFAELPGILTSVDILVSILEPAASRFSVPSKVLTYLCAGRPVLAVMDPDNAAARMIAEAAAGVVVDPAVTTSQAVKSVRQVLDDSDLARRMGEAARQLAEQNFDIGRIGDRFEGVLLDAAVAPPS